MLTVTSGVSDITLNAKALDAIAEKAGGADVTLTVSQVDTAATLDERQKEAVGSASVFDISVTIDGKRITDFNAGRITISLPYMLKDGEKASGVAMYNLDAEDNLEKLSATYDVRTKTVSFTTGHLLLYILGYVNRYDVSDGWYDDSLDLAVSKGLLDRFIADGKINAAQQVTHEDIIAIYLQSLGIKPISANGLTVESFAAVCGANAAYISTAKELGIVAGVDDAHTLFDPKSTAKRIHFFQIIKKMMDKGLMKTPDVDTGLTVSDFSDGAQIAAWAIPATNELINRGLIVGDKVGEAACSA
jgi:hypothetical protein